MDIITWAWLIVGAILALSELLVPGMVMVFLGTGAGLVALSRHLGWIEGWMQAFTLFFISSLFQLVVLRSLLQNLLPGDRERDNSELDADAVGTVVEVVSACRAGRVGEVRVGGVRWAARCDSANLEAGQQARLIARDNLTWLIEPATNPPADS